MISVENERDAIARLQGLQAYMSRELRTNFRVFRGSDYAAVVEAMRAGHSELGYLGPASYGLARRVMGERIAPIFRYIDNEGLEGYHSVMLVKADSPFPASARPARQDAWLQRPQQHFGLSGAWLVPSPAGYGPRKFLRAHRVHRQP